MVDEYSLDSYRSLLELAQRRGYRFASFLEPSEPSRNCIYLRHDVDFSVTAAVELARVNASLGVRATFFLLLRSEIYNVLSPRARDQVRELQALGQHVGLHYWRSAILDPQELITAVSGDFSIVRREVPDLDPVFSWHNPGEEMVRWTRDLAVPGLLNVYSGRFLGETRYFSDSNMRHSVPEFREILDPAYAPVLQLLLHPIGWVAGGASVAEILAGAWKYVLRDREYGMRTNKVYDSALPDGMPQASVDAFVQGWLHEVRKVQQPS